jgi:hypothetical protein
MIGTIVGFSPYGTAFIRPDGSERNLCAPKRVVNSCAFPLEFGDRVDVRIGKDRAGEMIVTKIAPAP